MNPSRIFILRPVGTSLLMVAILLAGIVAYRFLPLSALPQVDYPTIQVQTFYPGASPEVMTSSVTAPLEVQFGQMPGLNQMSSTSSGGASVITLQFSLNLNLDIAEQEVQAAINAAGNLLPSDLPAPPIYAKVNPADAPILTLGITSKTLPLTQLEDLADTRMAQKISQIEGVGLVSVSGGQRPAVRVIANVRALAAYGLNIDDLRTTIANANVNTPKGTLDGPARSWTLTANDQIQSPEAYQGIIVSYKNGNPVRLSDVAQVTNGAQNAYLAGWVNNTPGIILNVQRQPGANVIQVVDRIKLLLPQLSATLPLAVDVAILTDRTNTIRASVHDVEFELSLAVILVVLVIFLFLRSIPATLIPSLSVPLSLVGTLAAMYLLGFSLNNLSLMALTIATGFVVDDAIVMIENISRYIEEGVAPLAAALRGAGEIGFTIVSLTVSLIAVLIPLLFMGDVVGRLFHEFAITLAVTIVISALVSLTLVPMLCARLLRHHSSAEESAIARWANEKFQALIDLYGECLNWVLERQPLTLMVAIGTLLLTILLYVFIPKGFFPVQDTGLIQAITEAPQSVSYGDMARRQATIAAAILKDADVVSLSSFIGVDGTNITLNSGRMLINLKPVSARSLSASDIIRRLQKETADVPGISLYMQPVQDLSIDTTVSRTQYQFVLEDANPAEFNTWVPLLVDHLQQLPQLEDVASDQENQGLSAYLTIDRDTAGRFGITPATVDNALYDAFGQRIVSTIFTQSNQYRVILQADSSMMASLDSLGTIYLPSATAVGGQVPLSALVSVSTRLAPLSIDHLGQFPATTVSFNLASGAALGDAVNAIKNAEADIKLPASVMTTFQGAALAFQATLGNEIFLIIAAIVTVYIVLGVLYESFIHPITILSTLPSAGVGALLAYPVSDAQDPANKLFVRDTVEGERRVIPRESWTFADPTHVSMAAGFEPGRIYEVVYMAKDPVLVGLGPTAVRDVVSYLKYGGVAALNDTPVDDFHKDIRRTLGFGVSQSGRFLRTFLYDGFNQDEKDRRVFDGVWATIAGAGRGGFNARFAQPSRDGNPYFNILYPVDIPPFSNDGGLLAKAVRTNTVPKIFYTNGSYEYWGRDASLIHTTTDGKQDLPPSKDTRIYFFPGSQHGTGSLPPRAIDAQNPANTNDYRASMRALLLAMQAWLADGKQPPASVYPRIAKDELASVAAYAFPKIPGVAVPHSNRRAFRLDFSVEPPKLGPPFPTLVPQVNPDGNETSGIKMPEIQVPLASNTGWNLRSPKIGAPDELYTQAGSWIPFAVNKAERENRKDPRASIEERYPSKNDYLDKIAAAAQQLVQEGFLIDRDIPYLKNRAAKEWDYVLTTTR